MQAFVVVGVHFTVTLECAPPFTRSLAREMLESTRRRRFRCLTVLATVAGVAGAAGAAGVAGAASIPATLRPVAVLLWWWVG